MTSCRAHVAGRARRILDNILGAPAPPPPDIPQLKENVEGEKLPHDARADGGASSQSGLRLVPQSQRIRSVSRSRTSTGGAWRTEDAGVPIDASGQLAGRHEDRRRGHAAPAMLQHPEVFVRTHDREDDDLRVSAAASTTYDMPVVRAVAARRRASHDSALRRSCSGIVRSMPFQMRIAAGRPLAPRGHMFISKIAAAAHFLRGLAQPCAAVSTPWSRR